MSQLEQQMSAQAARLNQIPSYVGTAVQRSNQQLMEFFAAALNINIPLPAPLPPLEPLPALPSATPPAPPTPPTPVTHSHPPPAARSLWPTPSESPSHTHPPPAAPSTGNTPQTWGQYGSPDPASDMWGDSTPTPSAHVPPATGAYTMSGSSFSMSDGPRPTVTPPGHPHGDLHSRPALPGAGHQRDGPSPQDPRSSHQ